MSIWRQRWAITLAIVIAGSALAVAQGNKMRVKVEGPHGTFDDSPAKIFKSDTARITHFRRQEMRSISGHFRALEAVIRYQAPFKDTLLAHADTLQALSLRIPQNFVPETAMEPGKWGAKPEVWSEPAKFKTHYESFQTSIANLKTAITADNPTEMETRLTLARHECLACHKTFRVRRKK